MRWQVEAAWGEHWTGRQACECTHTSVSGSSRSPAASDWVIVGSMGEQRRGGVQGPGVPPQHLAICTTTQQIVAPVVGIGTRLPLPYTIILMLACRGQSISSGLCKQVCAAVPVGYQGYEDPTPSAHHSVDMRYSKNHWTITLYTYHTKANEKQISIWRDGDVCDSTSQGSQQ